MTNNLTNCLLIESVIAYYNSQVYRTVAIQTGLETRIEEAQTKVFC